MIFRKKEKKIGVVKRRKRLSKSPSFLPQKIKNGNLSSFPLFDEKRGGLLRNPTLKDTEIAEWLLPHQKNYKVRLAKLEGKNRTLRLGESISGYVESLPIIGQAFRVYSENGLLVMRTSEVLRIGSGYIKTENSIYKVEFVDEEDSLQKANKND